MKTYCACLFLFYTTNMAAACVTVVRTLTGFSTAPCRLLLTHHFQTPTVCHHSRLHVQSSAGLWSSRTEPQQSDRARSSAGGRPEEEIAYIPRGKARNPMMKIGYAWMIGLPTGIIGFLLAKRQVDKNRLKQMKIRQRMKQSNAGEYEGSRYLQHAHSSKLDQ